ncbi:2442_t:CDS:1, partial [Scutellospora calospora]
PKFGLEKTATYVSYNKTAIIKVLQKFHQNKDLTDRPRYGCHHITTST